MWYHWMNESATKMEVVIQNGYSPNFHTQHSKYELGTDCANLLAKRQYNYELKADFKFS